MNFNVYIPTKIISGVDCIKKSAALLSIGKHAFIVCGARGAKLSGALDDVTEALEALDIKYTVFDKSRENPPVEMCFEGGKLCRESGADFVIGIGGGSALDAAKAVALFAANSEFEALDVFDKEKEKNSPLPLIAVPTTSGTGSEANGTSVMSLPGGLKKLSFATEWPKVSFLDPKYTYSLSYETTISCALDAFAHAMESYLSPKSTPLSRMMAVFAAKSIVEILREKKASFSPEERQSLQNAACAAGIAISVTGTGFPHPMGYSITMLDGIPHGAACAVFYKYYIEYNRKVPEGERLINSFCQEIGSTPVEIAELIPSLANVNLTLTKEEIEKRVNLISGAKNYTNSPYVLSDTEKTQIYENLFLK